MIDQSRIRAIAPITANEATKLHEMGWSSGFGWDSDGELDWFHEPSFGPGIWVEDCETTFQRFSDDVVSVRREIYLENLQSAASGNAELILRALWHAQLNLPHPDKLVNEAIEALAVCHKERGQ